MKLKLLSVILFIAFALGGCVHGDKAGLATYYTYINGTSETISVKVGCDGVTTLQYNFEIAPGKENTLLLRGGWGGGIAYPFYPPIQNQFVIISNGKKSYKHNNGNMFPAKNTLFDRALYDEISITENEAYYKYIFTDKDFENAKPIESEK